MAKGKWSDFVSNLNVAGITVCASFNDTPTGTLQLHPNTINIALLERVVKDWLEESADCHWWA